ncbi:hypothetical protein MASR2M70_05720 [Bacillota bacterium]
MKCSKFLSVLLVVVLVFSAAVVSLAADDTPMVRVVFKAGEPDANGLFSATLTVYNATFNAFQFAFSYNKDAVAPADSNGNSASSFSACAKEGEGTSPWMVTLGNKLNTEKGLLECGGYVKPGSGSITADSSGIKLYTFTFKKIGKGDAGIKLAAKAAGGPYNPSIEEGGGLAEAGYNVDAKIEVQLPKAVGESLTTEILSPKPATAPDVPVVKDPKAARLENTVILQIGNGAAAKGGDLTRVDKNNALVMPYIDSNGRTMVPVRFLAESLGATVGWDGAKHQITISLDNKKIMMTVGSKAYTINGSAKTMDTVPLINKGWDRTMVPMRFVGEALGMDVKWDPVNKLVILSPLSNPWNLDGTTEKEVTSNILFLFSPIMRDFT